MVNNNYYFSYTNYEEIDPDGNKTGIVITGPKKITRLGMQSYCWPGCLTVMYDASKVGLVQIKNIRKNNDYAMWLKVSQKEECYLLPEKLAYYRRGRNGSISSQKALSLIKWHYKLFRDAEEENVITSAVKTLNNMIFGFVKKEIYVRHHK